MSRIKCLIVDDEELARELIESHLSQLDDFEVVASCASAIEASNVLKNNHIDPMFLDIEMLVLKGTDFYKNLLNKPKAIFTTAYRDYAVDGFVLDAVDYLLKPIVFSRFFKRLSGS
ncbi:MAG: two-component system LytT family response regulator [Arenicella sp.]|jgi:two-component system LytT family response regulator